MAGWERRPGQHIRQGIPNLSVSHRPVRPSSSPIRHAHPTVNSRHNNYTTRHSQVHPHRGISPGYVQQFRSEEHQRNVLTPCGGLEEQLKRDIRLIPSGNKPKKKQLSHVGYDDLWIEFGKLNNTKHILTAIYTRIAKHEHVDVGLVKPETFQVFVRIIGSADIEVRCLACSVLNLILRHDVQGDAYRSVLLQKDRSWEKVMCDVLRLENLGHCDEILQLKLLSEMCSLIYILCSTHSLNCKSLIQGGVVDCFINLIKGQSILYGFYHGNRMKVTNEIVNKKLKSKMEAIEYDNSENKYLLHELHSIEDGISIPIKECIAKSGLLWEDSTEQLAALRQESTPKLNTELEWREIQISAVISATEVFAHIDETSTQAVREIEETLRCYLKSQPQMLAEPPELNTYVILCEGETPCRCHVKYVNGETVTLFAFDYGVTKEVHYRHLCWLQPGILKRKFNKQAVRCKLKGFRNGSTSAKDLGLCLSILINLSRERSLLGPHFSKDDVIESLIHLVLCPLSGLVRHSMRVLLNMSYDAVIMNKLCSWNYMDVLLDKLTSLGKNRTKSTELDILHVSLETLSNMLHKNPTLQDKFTSASGLNLLLALINKATDEYTLETVSQLICNFIGSNRIRDVVKYEMNTRWQSLADVPAVERGFSVLLPPEKRPSHRRSRSGSRGSTGRSRSLSVGRTGRPEADSDMGYDAALAPNKLESRDGSSEDESNIVSCNDAQSLQSGAATFVKGHRIKPDAMHCEYFEAVYVQDIELLQAIQVIVGFLNSGIVGRIYTGILNHKVVGLRLNRDEKDQLRQGVDVMMKEKIEPMVQHNQYDINFHKIGHDLYVVEIEIRPAITKPLTCFRAQIHGKTVRTYFIRNVKSGETGQLSAQMVHERIIQDKEAGYLAELTVLERELKLLKNEQTKSIDNPVRDK